MINVPRVATPKTVAVADGVSRRGAVARLAGVSVAGAVAAGVGSSALASALNSADSSLTEYRGKFAIHGGKVISGYVTAPRGRHLLDVVVLTHGKAGYGAELERIRPAGSPDSARLLSLPDRLRPTAARR